MTVWRTNVPKYEVDVLVLLKVIKEHKTSVFYNLNIYATTNTFSI